MSVERQMIMQNMPAKLLIPESQIRCADSAADAAITVAASSAAGSAAASGEEAREYRQNSKAAQSKLLNSGFCACQLAQCLNDLYQHHDCASQQKVQQQEGDDLVEPDFVTTASIKQ